jgi:hypothetical protein
LGRGPARRKNGGFRTFIIWEIILHRANWQLFLEPVDLVQEQNDARLDKPSRIADAVK